MAETGTHRALEVGIELVIVLVIRDVDHDHAATGVLRDRVRVIDEAAEGLF